MKEQEKKQVKNSKKKLAKGLSSLFESVDEVFEINEASNAQKYDVKIVNISAVEPNPDQPRKHFSQDSIESLASSIEEFGFINPIVVQKSTNDPDKYMIITGERRYRSALHLGVEAVPVIVRDVVEGRVVNAIALIENIQREDLNIVEEALCISQLISDYDCSHKFIADKLGKSRPYITNAIRILDLPQTILDDVKNGVLSGTHARLVIGLQDAEQCINHIKKNKLSVRAAEDYVRAVRQKHANSKAAANDDTSKTNTESFASEEQPDSAIYGTSPYVLNDSEGVRDNVLDSNKKIAERTSYDAQNGGGVATPQNTSPYSPHRQSGMSKPTSARRRYKLLSNQLPEGSVEDIEGVLARETGMNIKIVDNDNSAELVIKFDSIEQLDYLIQALSFTTHRKNN